jgi:hypothetical protein
VRVEAVSLDLAELLLVRQPTAGMPSVILAVIGTIILGIVGGSPNAWAHSGSLDEHEKEAILIGVAVVIAFVALIWVLARRDEKRRDRHSIRNLPPKRRRRV